MDELLSFIKEATFREFISFLAYFILGMISPIWFFRLVFFVITVLLISYKMGW